MIDTKIYTDLELDAMSDMELSKAYNMLRLEDKRLDTIDGIKFMQDKIKKYNESLKKLQEVS